MLADGSHKRDTSGLLAHTQKKSEESYQRVLATIERMVAENRPVNYNSVAKEAGTSKTYLYRQEDLRKYIDSIREQQALQQRPTPQHRRRSGQLLAANEIDRVRELEHKLNELNEEFKKLQKELLKPESAA